MFGLFKKTDFKALKQQGAVVVDVRTKGEYSSGNIKGSRNIPLDNFESQIDTLKNLNKPIITCCASGMRSGVAKNMLKKHGVEAYNGGGYMTLENKL